MTNKYIKMKYYEYLSDMVRLKDQNESYYTLIRILYDFPFYDIVKNDDNRIGDGLRLRSDFAQELTGDYKYFYNPNEVFGDKDCSMLEMLIALSNRMTEVVEGRSDYWFWILLENLGLTKYTDDEMEENPDCRRQIGWTLYRFVERQYDYDGTGGLFPLLHPIEDQRNIEIWHQLTQYLMENGYFSFD